MKKIQFILLAVAFLTLALVVASLIRSVPSPEESKPMENLPPPEVDMQMGDVHYEQINQHGVKEWELNADSAQFYKKKSKIVLQSLKATFFSDAGKVYNLIADGGTLATDSRDVTVSGNVTAETDDGYQIETDSLRYSARERTISTDDTVTITGEKMIMKGKGMLIDLEKETLFLLKEVKASERK